jgi:hypothetical protein
MSVKFSVSPKFEQANVETVTGLVIKAVEDARVGDLGIDVEMDYYKPEGTIYIQYGDRDAESATLQAANIRNLQSVTIKLKGKNHKVTFESYEDAKGGRRGKKTKKSKKSRKTKKSRRYTRRR